MTLTRLGDYRTAVFDDSAAEIVAFDPATDTLFIVNGSGPQVDRVSIATVGTPSLLGSISVAAYGGDVTSAAVNDGVLAVAVPANTKTDNGKVVFFQADGTYIADVDVGALPDMLTFTPDGNKVLVANEGEPNDDYDVDPVGSVSIIDISGGVGSVTNANVTTLDWSSFNASVPADVRVFGPGASLAEDLEPEYIAVSADGNTAWVVMQENNALGIIDLSTDAVSGLVALGFKDHSQSGNELDPSDDDGAIAIANWPVFGMYQPDAIASFMSGGSNYVISANEGDARDYDGFAEEERIKDLTLDSAVFTDATIQDDEKLGRLTVTSTLGNTDADADYEALYAFGTRSVSVWDASGSLVWDSGAFIEEHIAANFAADFNSNNDENGSFESRSDNKGPEPEGVTVAELDAMPYAFVGLERQGGIMVWCLDDPAAPTFMTYEAARNFSGDPETDTALDLGPEGLIVIPAADSPNGNDLLVVANEVSGSTAIFQIDRTN